MGGIDLQKNIGAQVSIQQGVKTTTAVASTITGTYLDRHSTSYFGAQSCTFFVQTGDATGSPSAQTVDCKLQHSTASGSGFADVTSATTTQITADETLEYKDWDLSGLNRYIKLVVTVAFTGGSTPAIPVNAGVILGGSSRKPAV